MPSGPRKLSKAQEEAIEAKRRRLQQIEERKKAQVHAEEEKKKNTYDYEARMRAKAEAIMNVSRQKADKRAE